MPLHYLDEPPKTADLVVIGGGVIGAATAFYAARAGLRPLLLEARPALCTLTTPASTGAFRLQFDNREELEVVRESVEIFLDFEEVTGQDEYDLELRQQGYLWVTFDEGRAARGRELVTRQREWGLVDVELLEGDELRREFPFVAPGAVLARYRAGDGFLNPKALTMGMACGAACPVVLECPALDFELDADGLAGVVTARGVIATRTAVVACGPFSRPLAARAAVELPVTMVARQKIVFPDLLEVPLGAPMTIDDDTGAHWRPFLRGAAVLFTDPETPPGPPLEHVPVDHGNVFRVLRPDGDASVARVAPFWRDVWRRNRSTWMVQTGQYTMSPDKRPLLGPTAVPGLFVNTGDSGHGVMTSPAVARRLIDVVTGRTSTGDNPFRLDRIFAPRAVDLL